MAAQATEEHFLTEGHAMSAWSIVLLLVGAALVMILFTIFIGIALFRVDTILDQWADRNGYRRWRARGRGYV